MRYFFLYLALVALVVTIFSIVTLPTIGQVNDYLDSTERAKTYCAMQEQPHYCFEVAMQEGLEAVMAP